MICFATMNFPLKFFLVFLSFFIIKFSNPDTISFRPQTLLWSVIDDASTKFHSREPITSPDRTFGFSVRGNGPSNTNSKFTCFNYHYAKSVLFSHLLERFFLCSFLSKNSKVITAQLATMISQNQNTKKHLLSVKMENASFIISRVLITLIIIMNTTLKRSCSTGMGKHLIIPMRQTYADRFQSRGSISLWEENVSSTWTILLNWHR